MSEQPRQPAGSPDGGQFSSTAGAESATTLTPPSGPHTWRADTVADAMAETASQRVTGGRPHVDTKGSVAAMRADLKALFGTKFSARMASGSAYGWARVTWDDGPQTRAVQKVADRYCDERFDGSDDMYHPVNQNAPVRYSLRGVNVQRSIGPAGQRHIDDIFDKAGLTGYQRMSTDTGARDEYEAGYDWSHPFPDDAIQRVEQVLHKPLPGKYMIGPPPTAHQLARVIHEHTDYSGDEPLTNFSPYGA